MPYIFLASGPWDHAMVQNLHWNVTQIKLFMKNVVYLLDITFLPVLMRKVNTDGEMPILILAENDIVTIL